MSYIPQAQTYLLGVQAIESHLYWPKKCIHNFGLGFGITHQGESNIKNDKPGLILPDYTRVDFAAYYNISEDLSLQLNVENITDELYATTGYGSVELAGFFTKYYAPGAEYGVNLTYSF